MSDEDVKPLKMSRDEEDFNELTADPCTIDRYCNALVEIFTSFPDTKNMKLSHVFRAKAMQSDERLQNFEKNNKTSRTDLQQAFNFYYKKASQTNVVTAQSAVAIVKDYVNSGESIELHPSYPKNPLSAYNLYLRDQGISKFEKNDEGRDGFNQNQKVRRRYEDLYKSSLQEHVADLKRFITNEENLKEEHINHVTNRIRFFERKIDPKSVEKKRRGPTKRTMKSAFDFFKISKTGRYNDLGEDIRNKKLLRKFNKLPEDVKQVFVDLEQAQYNVATQTDLIEKQGLGK